MFLTPALLVLLVASPLAIASPQQDGLVERHSLAEISLQDPRAVRAAQDAGVALDCQSRTPAGLAEITVTERQLARMRQLGASVRILEPDLESFYAGRLVSSSGPKPLGAIDWDGGSMGGYFTLAEMESILDQLAAAHPTICTAKFSLGLSVEGRDLWAVKVSDHVATDEDEPEARIDAVHHAREPVSLHAALYFLDWLLTSYGVDPLATHLVNEREIWIVPCVNPDGYEYNRQIAPGGGGMWRKNRRDNGDGTFGVDLNRNYSYQWGYDSSGSSGSTSNETYRGPSATSEPETAAMEAFISSRDFQTSISAHTYSDLWLFPWGYTCVDPPQLADFELTARWFTAENGYVWGPICSTLYAANGDTVDYDFGVHGTWSGTIEIGGSADGFWPPTSRIVPLLEENLRAYQRMMLYAAAGLEGDDWSWQQSLGDGDPWLEPGEEFDLALTLENPGTLATSGAATITVTADHADVQIVSGFHDFGTIAAFGAADNLAAPLRIAIASAATPGRRVEVRADLAYDGYVESHVVQVVLGEPTSLGADDLELDFGWVTNDASDTAATGRWELADPALTSSSGQTSQPADDHSAAGVRCAVTDGRAGSGAGTYDVDGGFTTLTSPQFDLEDANAPLVSYWRWFTDLTTDDDELVAELSADDGATWTEVERVQAHDNAWRQVVFDPAALQVPLTDRMLLRWRVGDDPNNSLAEALIDDLDFQGFADGRVSLWRYGTPEPDALMRVNVQGGANQAFALMLALGGGSLNLKKLGLFELDLSTFFILLGGTTGSSGRFTIESSIPDDAALVGVEVHLQALVLDPAGAYLSNAVDFQIE